jgi:hypothetical protein
MVAQPLLWACLGECPWEEEGHPFHLVKYNVLFWGSPGKYLPREKKTCYQPSSSCTAPLWWLSVHLFIGSYLIALLLLVEAYQMLRI